MKSVLMIPLIFNTHELPIAYWCPELTSIFILHGLYSQLVTKIIFDGVKDFSCPQTEDAQNRKTIRDYETPIYNENGKIVATYNRKNRKLTVWHDRITTVVSLPEHTGMHWEN